MTDDKMIEAVALAIRSAAYPNRPFTHVESVNCARAALRAVREGQWQPIESAPKCVASTSDGGNGRKPVIVTHFPYNGSDCPMAIARLTADGWISGKRGNRLWFNPTHWMPLPTPPEAQEK